MTLADPDRPLRRDAERNRQRILDAARELFAEQGLGVTLNDIAHHAGVGVGTVYRRFPDKSQLIEELFEQRLEDFVALASRALDDPDAWHGLKVFLGQVLELQANDRGVKDLITASTDGLERIAKIRSRLLPIGLELVRRGQEAGQIRDDMAATDLPVVQLMLSTLIDASRDLSPDLWRRYLGIITRGLAAHPEQEPGLDAPPLAPDQVDHVMSFLKPARR
ncbi:MAG: TetR/AcrR family transcriptional regulator [Solirubrobacteraceae bacterium]